MLYSAGSCVKICQNMYNSFCETDGHTDDTYRKKTTCNSSVKLTASWVLPELLMIIIMRFKAVPCNKHSNYAGMLVHSDATSHIVRDKNKFFKFNDEFLP